MNKNNARILFSFTLLLVAFALTAFDKDALLADQLQWLKDSGFGNVDCVYKNFFVGVFLAIKE